MKRVLLAQHAAAYDKDKDPDRPLTPEGEKDSTKVAELLKDHVNNLEHVYHSGKLRAQQTARIFCEILCHEVGITEIEGLKPLDDPKIIGNRIDQSDKNELYVGHLPHMPKLVGYLVNGDPDNPPVKFNNGGIVSLIKEDEKGWKVDWIVTPSIVGKAKENSAMFV